MRGPSKWLFAVSPDGPGRAYLDPQWRRLRDQLELKDLRLHDLRHFYASGLIDSGCDVVTVQRAMGHSKAQITLDVYGHLWKTAEDRTRKAAQGLFAEANIRSA
ncbi:tyrosine-type recombinase/integrase [Leucobacter rhizosphaerae]|uniref:Tyrosine-type recombinase/integrase n=1 Tax=Leucobacter rhizosphaerae TaxID=2932245 RepID=A0ABY4FZZ4_9MICO|nr:tyrosine-type recombinase/integrase [Leucobacter rhizosphaerae]UOQ61892.1 tyrosine-type recombinase/integrase [Leucobacter rhizosphaerae]